MKTDRSFSAYLRFSLIYFVLLSASCSSSPSGEVPIPIIDDPVDAKSVLFIGNSFTNNNSMPEMVRRMAATTQRALLYDQHAPGGARISNHVESTELETKLASNQWDFVSIQAQSLELASEDFFVENTVFPGIKALVDKVRANHSESIPLFYMTWGLETVTESVCRLFPEDCSFDGMNDLIKERYLTATELNDAEVSPCGVVWAVVRERHPDMDLYEFDGSHPSILGSYAVALTFYTMIFKADPTLTNYHRDGLVATDEQLLREIVKEVVFDRLSEWRAN